MIDRFADLRLFTLIIERGSLTAAARELGLTPGAVSQRLTLLEESTSSQLLRRSTRRMQLTEAGDQFYRMAKRVIAEIEGLQETFQGERGALAGSVRVSAPLDLGRNYVAPAIDQFIKANPEISVSLVLSDTTLDLAEQGIDLAIRYGRLPDSSLILRRISSNRRVPVAAPAYLDRMGRPQRPGDLLNLNCMVLLRGTSRFDLWPFIVDGVATSIRVTGDRDANDGDLLRRWAIEGAGIVLKSAWDIADDLKTKRLEPLLVGFCPVDVDLQIVMPPGRQRPRRVVMLADYLTAMLRRLDQCLLSVGVVSSDLSGRVDNSA